MFVFNYLSEVNRKYLIIVDETELYCVCHQPEFGLMLGCDSQDCEGIWFHLSCVGLKQKPKTKTWFCPKFSRRWVYINGAFSFFLSSSIKHLLVFQSVSGEYILVSFYLQQRTGSKKKRKCKWSWEKESKKKKKTEMIK